MGFLQECQIVENARRLAAKRGLDPSRVTCCGCEAGVSCAYSSEDPLSDSTMDAVQNIRLSRLEGEQQMRRFDEKLIGCVQAQAIVENQQRSS